MRFFRRHFAALLVGVLGPLLLPAQQVMPHLLRQVEESPGVNLKVLGFAEDRRGRLWLATQDGVARLENGSFRVFHDPVLRGGDDYYHVVPSPDGRLWLKQGRGHALSYFDEAAERIVRLPDTTRLIREFLGPGGCHYVFADREAILWIGTRSNGLLRFDPRTGAIEHVFSENTQVNWIDQDRQGTIWFTTRWGATRWGVVALDPRTRRLRRYTHDPAQPDASLPAEEAFGIRARADGTVLVGLTDEVDRLDPNTGQVRRVRLIPMASPSGSPKAFNGYRRVYRFSDDSGGHAYFRSETALYRLTPGGDLQRVELPGLPEPPTVGFVTRANRLWISAGRRLYEYDLNRLTTLPPLNLLDVVVNGTYLEGQLDTHPGAEATRYRFGRDTTGHPTLTAREGDVLTLRFSPAVRYRNNTFRYRLEPHDSTWIVAEGLDATVSYQLPAGRYTLTSGVALPGGRGWDARLATMTVIVRPPFYKTGWFVGLAGVLLVGGLTALWRLIDRRRKLRRDLAQRELEATNLRQLSQLLSNITHEFRTPLTLILSAAEQLEKAPGDRPSERLGSIRRNAGHLLRLITQLLDTAKLDAGRLGVKHSLGEPDAFLGQAVQSFAAMAEKKSIRLTYRGEVGRAVFFDEEKLETIAYNLLSNALKFTKEGGEIVVRCLIIGAEARPSTNEQRTTTNEQQPTTLVLQITDTGPGIPADKLPRIFERFYQVDASSTRAHGGTGIGLSFVKELAGLLGGSVRVESTVGRGSTFTVTIPVEIAGEIGEAEVPKPSTGAFLPTAEHTPPGVLGAAPADAPLVLVVEDHDELRRYLVEILAPTYRVLEAPDGQVGLERALDTVPDLVLSDVMMPRLDGYSLLGALKADLRTSHVPVVLLTAKASYDSRLHGLGLGADAYLGKPFGTDELLLGLRNLLQTRRAWQDHLDGATGEKPAGVAVPEKEKLFLERLRQTLLRHLQDEQVDADWLAQQAHMSRAQLHRKLTALTNLSTTAFMHRVRLEQAAELLREGRMNVAEVAYAVGYGSQSYFTKQFREHFGQLPKSLLE